MRDPSGGPRVGVDAGASLIKLAVRDREGRTRLESIPTAEVQRAARQVAEQVAETGAESVVLTGGGAPRMQRLLASDTARANEFDAWASGARHLLHEREAAVERFLLVSVGTGTSAMLVEPEAVHRIGGTALGGGTILGLGAALTGSRDFDAITELAAAGDRREVDLLVSDIYPEGDFALPGEVNAASFAKLAGRSDPAAPRDLAHAVMGLVGENVALICTGLAAATGVDDIVFGGSSLRSNTALERILEGACRALGRRPTFLADGEFVGALGALELRSDSLTRVSAAKR